MPTYTPNYSFEQPQVGGDFNVWGGKINTVLGQIDTEIKTRADAIATINSTMTGLSTTYVKLDGTVAMTGLLTIPTTTPTANGHVISLNYLNTTLNSYALKASPALTGTPTAPTAAVDTNTTQIATTAYVVGQGYLKAATASSTYAPLASPDLTGTPTAPTAAGGTNTTQIATTAFVTAAIAAGGSAPTTLAVSSDQSKTNNTFTLIPGLDFAMEANAVYVFEGFFTVNCPSTQGIKLGIGATATAAWGSANTHSISTSNPTQLTSIPLSTAPGTLFTTTSAITNGLFAVRGMIKAGATPGNLQFFHAQSATGATAAIIRAGSMLRITKTA